MASVTYSPTHLLTMSTARQRAKQLRVSSYDRVSSWIVSLLVIAGVAVSALLIIYFTRKFILQDVSPPVTPVASGGGGTGGVSGTPGDQSDAPGVEDSQDVSEPQIQDTLSAV